MDNTSRSGMRSELHLFRSPSGERNGTLDSVAAGLGLKAVTGDVDSQNWNDASTASIVNTASRLTTPRPRGLQR